MPGIISLELDRSGGRNLTEFLDYESLEPILKLGNSASLKIVLALARQAQEGLTTAAKFPQEVRKRLCVLTGIPKKQHDLIIDFQPLVVQEGNIQVVCLKPIFNESLPKNARPPFMSWGQDINGSFEIMLVRPTLKSPGKYLYARFQQDKIDYVALFDKHIQPLLWADERHLMKQSSISLPVFPGANMPECDIATRAIFPF